MGKMLRARHRTMSPGGWKIVLLTGLGLITALAASKASAQTCTVNGVPSPASCYSSNPANWPAPARPYFMVVFDVSGSMIQCTAPNVTTFPNQCPGTAPANSCGLTPSRINDGKCALRKMVQAFSEVDFGLTSFTQTITGCGTTSPYACTPYGVDGFMPETANGCSITAACQVGTGVNAKGGTVRVPLPVSDLTVANMIKWTDADCENGNELVPGGATPINGALRDAAAHIRANVNSLTPSCRPVNVILITDGGESCDPQPTSPSDTTPVTLNRAKDAAYDLYVNGLGDGSGRNVKVYPIGFGGVTALEQTALNEIAKMGQCGSLTSACATGVSALTANNEADLSQKLSAIISGSVQPEECDNVDNNCNGCVDEGYVHYCNTNPTCCVWANATQRKTCVDSFKASLQTTPPDGDPKLLPCTTAGQSNDCAYWLCFNPKDVCDNADNNCNAGVDEGALKCNGKCPTAETCNGVDDDCDNIIDNAAGNSAPYTLPWCLKCNKSAEICDGCDNDCDGIADNGVAALSCGLPAPANCIGTRACKPAQAVLEPGGCLQGAPGDFWGTCVTNPGNEVCDGIDNNCNGTIDENVAPTPCEVPGQPGLKYQDDGFATSQCKKGQQPCNGQCAGWIGPSQEICDGFDNDCDGLVDTQDPDLLGTGIACGTSTGTCTKGTTACVSGVLVCQGGSQPQPEICDGFDNDCNGYIDDGALQDAPGVADKPCWDLPPSGCNPICSYLGAQWCPPTGANCHDLGTLVTPPCALGALGCKAGKWQCQGGTLPENEVCDGVDNNCNGSTDEGVVSSTCGINVGECKQGTQSCVNGKVTCDGSIGPTTEICDGKDNDCDGVIDNGIAIGTPCFAAYDVNQYPGPRDKGQCKPGVTECDAQGQQVCNGGVGPSPEVCDGLDNDCDGQVDESGAAPDGINGTADPQDPGKLVGGTCGKDVGACKPGTWACSSGQFVCGGGVVAQPEVCDCIDNDCDGLVDEDPTPSSGEPALCGTGKECVGYNGACQCAAKCGTGEFPCPTGGYTCKGVNKSGTTPPASAGNRCVTEPCTDCSGQTVNSGGKVECAPAGTVLDGGSAPPTCVCKGQAGCHNACYGVSCTPPTVCTDFGSSAGTCVTDNCWNIPCQVGQACKLGSCVDNPCKPNSCKLEEVCRPSADFTKPECRGTCAGVACAATEVCQGGKCVTTGCSQPCPTGQVCSGGDAGTCVPSKCKPDTCAGGGYCDPLTGACGNDPCSGVLCPTKQQCINGECTAQLDAGTDAETGAGGTAGGDGQAGGPGQGGSATSDSGSVLDEKGRWGLATGGGGCACKVGSDARTTNAGIALALASLGLLVSRRRKRDSEEK